MKTNFKKALFVAVLAALGNAQGLAADPVTEAYVSGNEPRLNAQERAAVKLAKQWRSNDDSSKPISAPDGSVRYYHGLSQPVMICAPMEVCIIKLQPGEIITALQAGDNVRWKITPAVVGTTNGLSQSEIVIKPTQVGLVSSVYIGTDKRSYHIKLKSSRTKFIPLMSFMYPDEFNESWDKYQKMAEVQRERQTLPSNTPLETRRIEDLDFNYEIDGKADWKPARVYNDGERTVIQMPPTMHQHEAPALLVLDEHGDENLVNSRFDGKAFIVDKVFNRAVLIAGVGSKQTRVEIERKEEIKGGFDNELEDDE